MLRRWTNARLGSKIDFLCSVFDVERYVSDSRLHEQIKRDLLNDKGRIRWLGFHDQTAFSKTKKGKRLATEAELRTIAARFHLGEVNADPDNAWHLLADQTPFESFTRLLHEKGYGFLNATMRIGGGSAETFRHDYRNPLLGLAADYAFVCVKRAAGAADRAMEAREEAEEELFARIPGLGHYHYMIGSLEEPVGGYLTMIEIATHIDGIAAAQLIAPSRVHPEPFFSKQVFVPSMLGAQQRNFRMAPAATLVDAIALVTSEPPIDLPKPKEANRFVPLSPADVRAIAENVNGVSAQPGARLYRGMITIRVTAAG